MTTLGKNRQMILNYTTLTQIISVFALKSVIFSKTLKMMLKNNFMHLIMKSKYRHLLISISILVMMKDELNSEKSSNQLKCSWYDKNELNGVIMKDFVKCIYSY